MTLKILSSTVAGVVDRQYFVCEGSKADTSEIAVIGDRGRHLAGLNRHLEEERVDRDRDRGDVVHVEQRFGHEVGVALIDHAIREIGVVRSIVG